MTDAKLEALRLVRQLAGELGNCAISRELDRMVIRERRRDAAASASDEGSCVELFTVIDGGRDD